MASLHSESGLPVTQGPRYPDTDSHLIRLRFRPCPWLVFVRMNRHPMDIPSYCGIVASPGTNCPDGPAVVFELIYLAQPAVFLYLVRSANTNSLILFQLQMIGILPESMRSLPSDGATTVGPSSPLMCG